jgi:hypothetical protein
MADYFRGAKVTTRANRSREKDLHFLLFAENEEGILNVPRFVEDCGGSLLEPYLLHTSQVLFVIDGDARKFPFLLFLPFISLRA